jgi:hypothetical protein
MEVQGLTDEEARRNFWVLSSKGLITEARWVLVGLGCVGIWGPRSNFLLTDQPTETIRNHPTKARRVDPREALCAPRKGV